MMVAYQAVSAEQKLLTKAALKTKLAELKYDLLKWIIGLALGQFAVLVSILLKLPR